MKLTLIEKQKIRLSILSIAENIDVGKMENIPFSLISGKGGVVLFFAYIFKFFKNDKYGDIALKLLEDIISESNQIGNNYSLANGFSGLGWLFQHLVNIDFLHPSEVEVLDSLDAMIYDSLETNAENYDLLYGLIGKGVYFLERKDSVYSGKALKKIVHLLYENAMSPNSEFAYWIDSLNSELNNDTTISLGLAHGMSGIVSFLIEINQQGIETLKTGELIDQAVKWIFKQKLTTKDRTSIFPAYQGENSSSRMAWCQGDLGILIMLEKLNERNLFTDKIQLLKTCLDRDLESSYVDCQIHNKLLDVTFCHGTSGIMHLFNRLSLNNQINNASKIQYWLKKTLDSIATNRSTLLSKTGVTTFSLGEDNTNKIWMEEVGILQGASGVGLVLLSLLFPQECNWDKIFLTNLT